MKPEFTLAATRQFEQQAAGLPAAAKRQLAKRLRQLGADPRGPALGARELEGALGDLGEKIFEACVGRRFRMTWEYGPKKGEITLRNVDESGRRD
ncbi:MAG: hypothetical protein ABII00_14065 [Elusimicrobiota bacterium]